MEQCRMKTLFDVWNNIELDWCFFSFHWSSTRFELMKWIHKRLNEIIFLILVSVNMNSDQNGVNYGEDFYAKIQDNFMAYPKYIQK